MGDWILGENYKGNHNKNVEVNWILKKYNEKIFRIWIKMSSVGSELRFVDFAFAFDSVDRDSLRPVMVADGCPQNLEADQGVLRIHQDEGKGKLEWLNALWDPLRRSITICSLSYHLPIQNWLDSWPSSTRLLRGSGWSQLHVSDLAFADDIVILSSSYSEMQGLFEAVNRPAATVGKRINASKTKVTSALIPGEQRQNKFE